MFSRSEEDNDTGAAQQFLLSLLSVLECKNINVERAKFDSGTQFICGFSSGNIDVYSMLLFLFPNCGINQIDDQFLITISAHTVQSKLERFFKETLNRILDKWNLSRACGDYKKCKFYVNDIIYSLISGTRKIDELCEAGLGLTADREMHEDGFESHSIDNYEFGYPMNFQRQDVRYTQKWRFEDVKMIIVDGYSSYIKFIRANPTLQQKLVELVKNRKEAFLQGFHKRLGDESSLSRLRAHPWFDPETVKEVFSYNDSVSTTSVEEIKSEEAKSSNDEKENKSAIEQRIIDLKTETQSCCFFNPSLKFKKIQFLKFVLTCKRVNPHFTFKSCIDAVKKSHPTLYEQATSGKYSTYTKELLNKIHDAKEVKNAMQGAAQNSGYTSS